MNKRDASGTRALPRPRHRSGRAVQLPETVGLGLPDGALARIDRAARESGMTRAEWIRACIRRGLDLARKQRVSGGGS